MKQNSCYRLEPIPIHRVAVLRPFVGFLTEVGAPIERGFTRPICLLQHSRMWITTSFGPFSSTWRTVRAFKTSAFMSGMSCVWRQLSDPQLTNLLKWSPTLYHGLMKAGQQEGRHIPQQMLANNNSAISSSTR